MVRVVPLRAETRVKHDMQHDRQAKSCQLDAPEARSVKRPPALHCGSGKRVRAAHCSSRVVWFQWTGLSVRRLQNWKAGGIEQWHGHSELHSQSRATACGDACQVRCITIVTAENVPTRRPVRHAV